MTKHTGAIAAIAISLLLAASLAPAQSDELVNGQVMKINEAAGKIAIKHGPIRKLGMDEGIAMVFRVGDPAMLTSVKPGDRVRFVPDRVNGQFTVIKIEKTK